MPENLSFPIGLTIRVVLVNAVLFSVFAPLLAYWIARSRTPAAKTAEFLVTLPLIFPPVALGYLLLLVFGKQSFFGGFLYNTFDFRLLFTEAGVVLAAFVAGLPLIVKPLAASFASEKLKEMEEAGRSCGLDRTRNFLLVSLPLVKESFLAGLLLALARASGEVGITLMLGGNVANKTNTLSLEVYNSVARGDFDTASQLCAVLAAFALVLYLLLYAVRSKKVF